jgi:hypothetical protein
LQDLEEIDQTNPEHIIFVLKMAFSIAPSLFGFTLFVLGGTLVELFAFVLVSYLILAFYFLRREKETPNPAH